MKNCKCGKQILIAWKRCAKCDKKFARDRDKRKLAAHRAEKNKTHETIILEKILISLKDHVGNYQKVNELIGFTSNLLYEEKTK